MTTRTTTTEYWRSHQKAPRGRGYWAFQRSRTENAYERDFYGEIAWFHGTYTEARKQAQAAMADARWIAALP